MTSLDAETTPEVLDGYKPSTRQPSLVRGAGIKAPVTYDKRYKAALEVKRLTAEYVAQLGGPDIPDTLRRACERAAELRVLARQSRASALATGTFDPTAVSRIEGIADRAERRLDLPDKTEPEPMTLAEYAATKAGKAGAP